MLEIPVVFIIFNKPDATRIVFERIRIARPSRLYVIADGPRLHVSSDAEKVMECRNIAKMVDWPCSVINLYSEVNMGCNGRIISGLDVVFDNEECAIILEDDCCPGIDFFNFCNENLKRYRLDDNVMHIGGNNFQLRKNKTNYSYWFSAYTHIWGWATWARAWKRRIGSAVEWDESEAMFFFDKQFSHENERKYWKKLFTNISVDPGGYSSWDYLWTFTCWKHSGYAVYPAGNLVKNIGIGRTDATHTKLKADFLSIEPSVIGKIIHPPRYLTIPEADHRSFLVSCEYRDLRIKTVVVNTIRIKLGKCKSAIKNIFGRKSLRKYNNQ